MSTLPNRADFTTLCRGCQEVFSISTNYFYLQSLSQQGDSKPFKNVASEEWRLRQSAKPKSAKVVQIRNKYETSLQRVYNKVIYILARICAGVKRNLTKICFFCGNSSEARWFRVPPPEVPMRCFTIKVHFLLTIRYKVRIIYICLKANAVS